MQLGLAHLLLESMADIGVASVLQESHLVHFPSAASRWILAE